MKIENITKSVSLTVVASLFVLSAIALPVLANENDEHHEHDDHMEEVSVADEATIEKMQALIVVLQQLIELLMAEADAGDAHVHDDSHEHDEGEDTETLAVWVEIHSSMTHVHVIEVGSELDTFFLEDLEYTEEEAIIAAIADETGLLEEDIEAVISFPSGELDENGDSIEDEEEEHEHEEEHEDDDELDLDGIHIMGDGTVMLGNGEEVEGATVNDDDMIVLEDGTIVEPEFDLR